MNGRVGEIVLVRHGETAWSAAGKRTSYTELDLTPDGERQAREMGAALAGRTFVAVLCSPRLRARRSAELAGLRVTAVDDDLAEWSYGEYEGLTTPEIRARRPGWYQWTDGCPGGESPADVSERADRVVNRARQIEGDVLIFSSGHFLRVLTTRWLGLEVTANARFFMLSTASLSAVGYEGTRSRPVIRFWNDTDYLEDKPGKEKAA